MEDSKREPTQVIVLEGNIPVLPDGIPHLLHALEDDDVDFKELTRLLEEFPSIAGRLIAVANSAWAAPTTPVLTLLDSCTRIGLTVVRGLAIALAVTAPFNVHRCPDFEPERFWSSALLAADGAELLGRYRSQGSDAQLLRTAGLLHHLGLLWLADRYPMETSRALNVYAETPGVDLAQALRDLLGTDYCEVGGRLAQVWSLPAPLTDVMCYHRTPNYEGEYRELVRAVGDAVRLVRQLYDPADIAGDRDAGCDQSVTSEQCRKVFDRLQQRFDNTVQMASSFFSD